MKKILKRILSIMLASVMLFLSLPVSAAAAVKSPPATYTLSNENIKVVVSKDNGGFVIRTVNGDALKKDDNNKNLLYHSGLYDTSFTSFRVDYGQGKVKDYIFGGDYGFLGLGSSDVAVTQDDTGITAVWTVDNIKFTQRIELSTGGSQEHGMASIKYSAENQSGTAINVKVRVLLDTALGTQDYGYYQLMLKGANPITVESERIITETDGIPASLYAVDDLALPSVTAYTVNPTSSAPYQIAFGHWNNLAAALFDFAPDNSMTFTNLYNADYLTADSAYALYYDLGSIAPLGGTSDVSTYYGVYSNVTVAAADSVSINVVAPTALTLSSDRQAYNKEIGAVGDATFAVDVNIENFISDKATDLSRVALVAYTAKGITPMNNAGKALPVTPTYTDPHYITLIDMAKGDIRTETFQFKADVDSAATYRKMEFRAYDISNNTELTEQNLIGSTRFYILCPGGDGELPTVTFTGADPAILYYKGTNHYIVTGTNFNMLEVTDRYSLKLKSTEQNGKTYDIPSSNIYFPEGPSGNIMDIVLNGEYALGSYNLYVEWTDVAVRDGIVTNENKSQTAPALNITFSNDASYKNDSYGILIVYQDKSPAPGQKYYIKSFRGESQYNAFKNAAILEYSEIILEFRGEFVADTYVAGIPTSWTATSLSSGDNVVSLNNCIDFENGVLQVHYTNNLADSGSIQVDFDGDLYTSDARTSIWSGKAALTEIENGKEYSLMPYDDSGERSSNFTDNTITLLWPSALGMAQTLCGLAFNMTYGQLGVMKSGDGSEIGRVLSFSANMKLDFLIPKGAKAKGIEEDTTWKRIKNAFSLSSEEFEYSTLRTRMASIVQESSNTKEEKDALEEASGKLSVMVNDILYGCGEGFIGFRTAVDLTLPAYTESMPKMNCKLSINTIGNWSFGVAGGAKFMNMIELEFEIAIKSYKNIPVPDKLYFFISGFEPGINVDGVGVLWLTGGGGGIDNLYDTIFASDTLPSLKLLLSVSFDVLKILSARADLSLSLRGISFTVSGVKIKATDITVLNRARLKFDWYPDWYFMVSVSMDLLDCIQGSGYIVVIDNDTYKGFVEFFVRAKVKVPSMIPIVGGIEVGGVDFGVNNEKIWGVGTLIGIKLGIVYYWSGKFNWGTGDTAQPTFPELLGYNAPLPVYYDEETGETLYMCVGTNLSVAATAQIIEDGAAVPKLLGIGAKVTSNLSRTTHTVNMGAYASTGEVFTITFDAIDKADAILKADNITMSVNGGAYTPTLYDTAENADNSNANANLTYDPDTGKGTLAITVTDPAHFSTDWTVNTPVSADVVIYSVAAIPEVTSVSAGVSGSNVTVNWSGAGLDKLDQLDFYLTADDGTGAEVTDMGTLIASYTDTADIGRLSKTIALPGDLQTGTYYIKAIYKKEGVVNGSITGNSIDYINTNQPAAPSAVTASDSGDAKFTVNTDNNTNADYDGYIVNVYKADGTITDISNALFARDGTNPLTDMVVGGSYTAPGKDADGNPITLTYGLTGGQSYKIGVMAYKNILDGNGDISCSVLSTETLSDLCYLNIPTPSTVTLTSSTESKSLARNEYAPDDKGAWLPTTNYYDTFAAHDISFTAVSGGESITGKWEIDGTYGNKLTGIYGDLNTSAASQSIALTGLADGDHTLTVWGTDATGDSFNVHKTFTVDTTAPRLLVSSPLDGSCFTELGMLTVAGVTDSDALFTVTVDGSTVHSKRPVTDLCTPEADGTFSFTIPVPQGVSSHQVTITAEDAMGNSVAHRAKVKNQGLASIESLDLYMSDTSTGMPVLYSNANLTVTPFGNTIADFSLVANTRAGSQIVLKDPSLVTWSAGATEGSASITDSGRLTVAAGSIGYVVGGLRVASNASMTAAATFGSERYSGRYNVVTAHSVGGTVSGAGTYRAGDTVTITATPLPGYAFDRWSITGVTIADQTPMTLAFTMPSGNVIITAYFRSLKTGKDECEESNGKKSDGKKIDGVQSDDIQSVSSAAGVIVTLAIPAGADANTYVPYYYDSTGTLVPVPFSMVTDGTLTFLTPLNTTYFLMEADVDFNDIADDYWAGDYIEYCAARRLFNGIGDGKFDPAGPMTRAMFVTVLWRLAGSPAGTGAAFSDAADNEWYTEAVAWANASGIITGYGNGLFGTNDEVTREQMCTIFLRYLQYAGYELEAVNAISSFADSGEISSWAADAVTYCQQAGLVNGKGDNLFDPLNSSTRAEVCTVFYRLITSILRVIK